MPQLGETVTEGTITRWLKQVGDPVAEDDVLFEVSTDKVDSEIPSPVAGVLTEIRVPEGETVDVGTTLAVVSEGRDAAPPEAQPENERQAPPEADPAGGQGSASAESDAEAVESEPPAGPEPTSDLRSAPGPDPAPLPEPARASGDGSNLVLSPVVRRLVAEHDLDPSQIKGTGAGGRITRSDVLALIDRQNGGTVAAPPQPAVMPAAAPAARVEAPAAPARAAAPPAASPVAEVEAGERDKVVPFTNIRRRTAEHMVRSKHTSAHTMVAVEVDYFGVDKVRKSEAARFKASEGFSLTYLPFVTRAVVDALEDFPNVNSSVGDDALIVHGDVNIGIAVDLDFDGLLVPVIHRADGKRLRVLAGEISTLAAKARSKKLTMDDITGGTFTITNAGPFGTLITVPVINQPQVAILSTDGVRKRPVVVELADGSDAIAVHPVGNLVMSWDHRAFDGAYAAAFLRAIKEVIETRDWSAEL
jgi:2-oxoglutarate dehydrogenase E2 component (dihydrolipoamide succinyltransferase)